jgi:hypothetical protein
MRCCPRRRPLAALVRIVISGRDAPLEQAGRLLLARQNR